MDDVGPAALSGGLQTNNAHQELYLCSNNDPDDDGAVTIFANGGHLHVLALPRPQASNGARLRRVLVQPDALDRSATTSTPSP